MRYTVAQDVTVGGMVLIPMGTPAFGTVEASRGAGAFGRAGRLRIGCNSVTLPSGVRVPLQAGESGHRVGTQPGGRAVLTGGAFGFAVGAATYTGTNLNDNLFNAHPDHFAPTAWALAAGIASGALIGSLFHGGDVTLVRGGVWNCALPAIRSRFRADPGGKKAMMRVPPAARKDASRTARVPGADTSKRARRAPRRRAR